MSYTDTVIQQFLQKWILPLLLTGIGFKVIRKYGPTFRDRYEQIV